jgi:hypothetical protein
MNIFPDDSWSVGTFGDDDAELVLVRARTAPPSPGVRAGWPKLVVVTWPYEPASGMPQATDGQEMERFEAAVEAGVERGAQGILVATLTGAGHKEWRYYAPDSDAVLASLNASLKGHPVYPLEIEVFTDPEWQGLSELLPGEGVEPDDD